MRFIESSAVIPVDLAVTHYRIHAEDQLVEVWGYVGDYEVCVHLPLEQARSRGLRNDVPRQGKKPRTKPRS
jgi:hypothetical protein